MFVDVMPAAWLVCTDVRRLLEDVVERHGAPPTMPSFVEPGS